jgi:hypothetical protein
LGQEELDLRFSILQKSGLCLIPIKNFALYRHKFVVLPVVNFEHI